MKSRRVAHRYRLALLLALGIGLALGSFWLLQVMHGGAAAGSPEPKTNEPDYYVENFNFVRTSRTGEARYNIAGARMIHRPRDDTYEITLPVIHGLGADRPPLTMRAQRALVEPDSSKVHMMDHVEVDRPAAPGVDRFHLTSEYLLFLPDDDVVRTDKPVDLTLGTARLTGVGMYVNNATREFRMAQSVHGVYPPRR